MSYARSTAVCAVVAVVLGCPIAATEAGAAGTGGARAPAAPLVGGSEPGVKAPAATVRRPVVRPVVSELSVPSTATSRKRNLSTRKPVIEAVLGWIRTGRTIAVSWPRNATLKEGRYSVTVNSHDHHYRTLLRGAHSSGVASLTVAAKAVKAPPAPTPPATAPAASTEAGVPTPTQTAAAGAVFPVAGAHNFGGPENVFGAPRSGYSHQGQDILTTEGTPVVAPMAGTILTTSYQAAGAGYYAVEQTGEVFDFMFAHCMAASLAVSTGQAITAGQALCKAGQTGDATAPHLDFEIWVGGWQVAGGKPIDPLPYLQAWEGA